MAKKYDIKLAVLKRWLRTIIPQIPAATVYLIEIAGKIDVPYWVVPGLVFIGSLATALDKFLREINGKRKIK